MPRRPVMNDDELREWFFNQKVITDSGCWEWTRMIDKCGYGRVHIKRKLTLVHRYSFQLSLNRPLKCGVEVMHKCHNRKCFNPEHLIEGTHSENMKDMVNSGRQARGEELACKLRGVPRAKGINNGRAKLTEDQVTDILNSSEPSGELAMRYGVSKTTILRVRHGETWNHLTKVELLA